MKLRSNPVTCALCVVCWLLGGAMSGSEKVAEETPSTPSWTHPGAFLAPEGSDGDLAWPAVRAEARVGAYWWWPGNAVNEQDITWNLETYRRAGWGNMGVIGIYGVRGQEDRFIDIFSPRWFQMFNHAVAEAERLGMHIDLTPSSGWRIGGAHVPPEFGEMKFVVEDGGIVGRHTPAKVKRAGPGGQGLAINPYSQAAVCFHLDWLSQRFDEGDGAAPRAFYYDSFENPGNWCPELPESFRKRRGYALAEHAAALAGPAEDEHARRVLCDYRETLSDLLLGCVDTIIAWAAERDSGLRMQAHGAPANLLDMYAAAAIPETEVFGASEFAIPGFRRDPQWIRPDRQSDLVNRFASSAAHVAGRPLVISESFTWLRNHYHTTLAQIKAESDKLLLNGINCIYYHGVCYAPQRTEWPGWLFYASTQGNARNSIFRDVPALNAYITRIQSELQAGRPHNDVLLYWPIHDLWMAGGRGEQRFSVHHPEWIEGTDCGAAGRWMIAQGHTFDFLSDRQLSRVTVREDRLLTAGGNAYRTVLVPAAEHMPVDTAQRLLDLARAGATVLVWKRLPRDVPGWFEYSDRRQQLKRLLGQLNFDASGVAQVGQGRLVLADDLPSLLRTAGVAPEPMVDHRLQFIRRKHGSCITYFIVNHAATAVDDWVPVTARCRSAVLLDPMTARAGVAATRGSEDRAEIRLQLQPGETRVLRVFSDRTVDGPRWPTRQPAGPPVAVDGTWHIEFVEGGPHLPDGFTTDRLTCWTQAADSEAQRFAGAARYTTRFDLPVTDPAPDGWFLDLGDVRESARVWINGQPAGIMVADPSRIDAGDLLQEGPNEIVIEVTNLSANRIRDLDRRGVDWKKFHDINIVDHMYQPFDASEWQSTPSGLLGPVTLHPYRVIVPATTAAT